MNLGLSPGPVGRQLRSCSFWRNRGIWSPTVVVGWLQGEGHDEQDTWTPRTQCVWFLGLEANSHSSLLSLLLAPSLPAPRFYFLPLQPPVSGVLALLPFPPLPGLLVSAVAWLLVSLLFPSFFSLVFLHLARFLPAPVFSSLRVQLSFSVAFSLFCSRLLPVPPVSLCRTWKLRLVCLRLFRSGISDVRFFSQGKQRGR